MSESLAEVVGRNARRLRLDAGVTLEHLAQAAARYGLAWSTGRVGDLEGGRVSPTFPTIYALTLALRDVTGQDVRLFDLLIGSKGEVALNESLTVTAAALIQAVVGGPVGTEAAETGMTHTNAEIDEDGFKLTQYGSLTPIPRPLRESDVRLARDIGVDPAKAKEAMLGLWGRLFSEERDERAGAGANAQAKGQISRKLKTELVEALQEGGGGDGND
jgi:hypothetical protein